MEGNIEKVKHRLRRKKRISVRKLSMELGIYDRSGRRIMKNDLGLRPYKIVIESLFPIIKRLNGKNLQIGFEQIFKKRTL